MKTVGELKAFLADIPDYAWVCLEGGPVVMLEKELGASEPFVLLTGKAECLHGAPRDERCGACEAVREDMGLA